jgi:DNA-binding MarR family transcriptional regulator
MDIDMARVEKSRKLHITDNGSVVLPSFIDDEPNIASLGKVLVSPSKIGIVLELGKHKKMRFKGLIDALKETSGNLNYHILTLEKEGLMGRTNDGEYYLTGGGNEALKLIREVARR